MSEAVSKCGACGAEDDHPKHQIMVGFQRTIEGFNGNHFHEHDFTRSGVIFYHFDCDTAWHTAVTNPTPHEDPGAREQQQRVSDTHMAIMAQARAGLRGNELRQWIVNLNPRGGAGGIDQTMANGILNALSPNSGTKTIGALTITGPISMRIMTANGSDTSAGTEQATSQGYTAGGSALSFAPAATGAISTNAAVSWTNFPSCTTTGMEQWDASGTKQRTFWGPWSGGNIVIASGNTFTVSSGNLTDSLA